MMKQRSKSLRQFTIRQRTKTIPKQPNLQSPRQSNSSSTEALPVLLLSRNNQSAALPIQSVESPNKQSHGTRRINQHQIIASYMSPVKSQRGQNRQPRHLTSYSATGFQSCKPKTPVQRTLSSVPEQIMAHISKHSDVDIVINFEKYRQQIQTKSKRLPSLLTKHPEYKEQYLQDSNSHFTNGLQHVLLDQFRKGIIVAGSWDNLRQEAVDCAQQWQISWIQRNLRYKEAANEQNQAIARTCAALGQLKQYGDYCCMEELPF